MKKKLICVLLTIFIISSIAVPVSFIGLADDTDSSGSYKFTSSTSTLEIFNDTQMVDTAENDVAQYPWYDYRNAIEHIIIHDGVTKISDYAFCRQDNLVDIVIPDSVKSIGIAALSGNDKLLRVELSNNIEEIRANAFGFNSKMTITEGFECVCPIDSYAQRWCLKNYVPFETPFSQEGFENVTISETGKILYWSIVPTYDCNIEFLSNSNYDTEGLIYSYDDYTYDDKYSTMKTTAKYYSDDTGMDLDFKIKAQLEAGKRYYLATKFKLSSKQGSYRVELSKSCVEHCYEADCLSVDFETGQKQNVELICINCGEWNCISFSEAIKNNYSYCDVNNDGIVNAKDYAMLLKH